MLHIATVHWKNEQWIDIQLGYLQRHLSCAYRVYAFLNEIPAINRDKFFYTSVEPIREHAVKLNILADVIRFSSKDQDDLLMFLDGDAFPIADPIQPLLSKMAGKRLVAVQRLENNGDRQPHPCFCVTTVGFWTSLGGDWKAGHTWNDRSGRPVTDVGGNLLGQLEKSRVDWLPLHRSNRVNLHPLWFGIYGGAVYHHGAGFRPDKCSRADIADLKAGRSPIIDRCAHSIGRLLQRNPIRALRPQTALHRIIAKNGLLSEEIFERIKNDRDFHRSFAGGH
jgi:hypothetical protein